MAASRTPKTETIGALAELERLLEDRTGTDLGRHPHARGLQVPIRGV